MLLTPGPYNETYFEHAYIARYLGFTLVGGGDLTVRDRRVFLKTLDGLEPVDVILRRVDDSFCDPLELRGDSFLGVPGLVEAARAGNVASPTHWFGPGGVSRVTAFLPRSAAAVGEELKLPSVGTWWCGQPDEHDYFPDHLDELVIKRPFPQEPDPIFGRAQRPRTAGACRDYSSRPARVRGAGASRVFQAPVWHGTASSRGHWCSVRTLAPLATGSSSCREA